MFRRNAMLMSMLAALAACGATSAPATGAAPDSLQWETVQLLRTFEGCDAEAEGCSFVRMSYPRITSGPTAWALEGLPQLILQIVGQPPFEGDVQSPEDVAEAFLAAFAEARREFPDLASPWALECHVTIAHFDDATVTLRADEYINSGGAHPNSFRTYQVAALADGRRIDLRELFDDSGWGTLLQQAEAAFRAMHGVAAGASLVEAGFWFPDDAFELPDNWGFEGDDLVLYYNAYDVAPYVVGPTELRLPRQRLPLLSLEGVREP